MDLTYLEIRVFKILDALLNKNSNITDEEVRFAIKDNFAYVGITQLGNLTKDWRARK